MIIGTTPSWLELVTAVWFALIARRGGRSLTLWAVSGALFALVVSTLILGLGQAMTVPFSDRDRSVAQSEWTIAVVVVVAVLGFLFTLGLYRQKPTLQRTSSAAAALGPVGLLEQGRRPG